MKNNNCIFDLKGKIAVVTGGAGLLGRSMIKAMAESGAKVVLADIDKDSGERSAKKLSGYSLDVVFRHLDIGSKSSVTSLLDFIESEYGRVNIWVNNAYPRTADWGDKFEKISYDSWRKNVDMHLNGYFLCCQKAAERMKKKREGSIINIASIYGILGPDFSVYKGTQMTSPAAYSAIKGGIVNFTRYLASYYGRYNIRVNCISPGGVFDNQPAAFVKRYIKKTPLGRMASPEDVAMAAVYLGSNAAAYITGHNLVIDGGWSAI